MQRDSIERKLQPVKGCYCVGWDEANWYVDVMRLLGSAGKDQRMDLGVDIGVVHRVVDDHAVLPGSDNLERGIAHVTFIRREFEQ